MESKKSQNLARIAKIGVITGAVVTMLSFFISLVPCTGEGLCKLPNPFANIASSNSEYYGISNNPITGLALQFIIPALLISVILMFTKKRPRKVLDLTRK